MSVWSSISKALSKLLKGGKAASVAGGAAQTASSVISWGSAAKVAIAGAFTYLFLSGGASNVVSKTLGIPEYAAQVLIVFLFLVLLLFIVRYLVNYCRDHYGLKDEYLRRPVVNIRRNDSEWYDDVPVNDDYLPRDIRRSAGADDRYSDHRHPDDIEDRRYR